MSIRGYIAHNGYTFICPCGNVEEFESPNLNVARSAAGLRGWHDCPKSGWTCPACYRKYAGEVSGDDLALNFTEETKGN